MRENCATSIRHLHHTTSTLLSENSYNTCHLKNENLVITSNQSYKVYSVQILLFQYQMKDYPLFSVLPTEMASHQRLIIWMWIFCLSRGGTWKRGNIFERPVREDIASQRCIFFNIVQTGWGVKPTFNSLLGLLTTYN